MLQSLKRPLACACAAAVLCQSVGCATVATGIRPNQDVAFSSKPAGASIYVDEEFVGKTPLHKKISRDQEHTVRFELEGYEAYTKDLKPGFNGWFLGNIILGGLVGMVVDVATGATTSLSPSRVSVDFAREARKAAALAAKGNPDQAQVAPAKSAESVKRAAVNMPKPEAAKPAPAPKSAPAPKPVAKAKPAPEPKQSNDPRFRPAPRIKVYED